MSQQLQITGGAKVRSLEGVITGSTGVLGSLPINGSNGIPQLDSNGKILVSQLPNSVMEYLGTWNAATNTPTLANGTGNAGDVYLCNVAGTVNFGAGPITFYVGDQVIYSGTIWQRASGATGSVTSVAVTETGDALTITGSPITTSGTINIGFAGTSAQYVAGDGTLVTFPTITTEAQRLITEVYNETGATLTKGTVVYINGGHGNLPTIAKALATSDATSAQTYGVVQTNIGNNNNGYVVVIGSLGDLDTQAYSNGTQLYLSSTTAGAWTSTKQYAPAHLVYVGIVTRSHPTQGVVEIKIQNGYELDELHNVSAQTPSNNDGIFYNTSTSLWESKSIATALGYTPANGAFYVTLGTLQTITGTKIYSSLQYFDNNVYIKHGISGSSSGYTTLGASASGLNINLASGTSNNSFNFASTSAGNTYTFPNATGTVALTSDLAGYLPLTGGTLTGALSGTNASFNYVSFNSSATAPPTITGFSSLTFIGGGSFLAMNIKRTDGQRTTINLPNDGFTHQYDFPSTDGTIALTSNLSSYVPTSRTLTINGTTYDLSADRSWTVSGSQWTTSGSNIYYNTGNVGIGLTNPAFPLEVSSTSTTLLARFTSNQVNAAIRIVNSNASGGRTYSIGSGASGSGAGNNFYIYDETNGTLRFAINNNGDIGINSSSPSFSAGTGLYINSSTRSNLTLTDGTNVYNIFQDTTSAYHDLRTAGSIIWRNTTGNTERMRITSGGTLLINSTTDAGAGKIEVNGAMYSKGTSSGLFLQSRASNANILGFYAADNTNFLVINVSVGNIAAINQSTGVYTPLSDINKKKDFENSTIGLNAILGLKPTLYRMKSENNTAKHLGFIAQEVKEFIPQAYVESGEEDDKFIGLDYQAITVTLVKAIQELEARIKTLENK